MKPREQVSSGMEDMFRHRLENLLDRRHPLIRLAQEIDWSVFSQSFGGLYDAELGRPGLPIRLLVGLQYLKHAFDMSDEEVVRRWVENRYWQYFCGEEYFQHRLPLNGSQLSRFRERIGEAGCELMLKLTVATGIALKTVSERSLSQVTVDTTVQEKAVAFPTDARLYHKARVTLVRLARTLGIALRQSYLRVGKRALFMHQRYQAARQPGRGKRELKKLKTYLGRVYRDVQRQLSSVDSPELSELLERIARLLAQRREDSHKLYSIHAPEVECIAKGKAHKKVEFGVKVSVATSTRSNFVVGMRSLPGNPYDGHTLSDALDQVRRLTGVRPTECFVDRGYRGHDETDTTVVLAGQRRGITPRLKRLLKRRNAIEPVIGHLKNDGRLDRNYLKGVAGDAMNALLVGAGHNLRLILRKLRLLFAWRAEPDMDQSIALVMPALARAR